MKKMFLCILIIIVVLVLESGCAMMAGMPVMLLGHLKGQSSEDGKVKLSCTEGWLKKAVELQQLHIKDPASITNESQVELMRFLKNAQDCTETTPATQKSEGHGH